MRRLFQLFSRKPMFYDDEIELVLSDEDVSDLDYIFLRLQLIFKVDLHKRASVIIFDEVQLCPMARQAIKHLVKVV